MMNNVIKDIQTVIRLFYFIKDTLKSGIPRKKDFMDDNPSVLDSDLIDDIFYSLFDNFSDFMSLEYYELDFKINHKIDNFKKEHLINAIRLFYYKDVEVVKYQSYKKGGYENDYLIRFTVLIKI